MPEGDRWRDDETELQRDDKGNGFLADDEAEGGEESTWNPEKTPLSFTPHVRIVHPSSKEPPEGSEVFLKKDEEEEQQRKPDSAAQFYPDWAEEESRRSEWRTAGGGRSRLRLHHLDVLCSLSG